MGKTTELISYQTFLHLELPFRHTRCSYRGTAHLNSKLRYLHPAIQTNLSNFYINSLNQKFYKSKTANLLSILTFIFRGKQMIALTAILTSLVMLLPLIFGERPTFFGEDSYER